MKYKIILGIIIPLLVIIILITLTTLNTGFSVKKNFVGKLSFEDVFQTDYQKSPIKIADITLENNYFLGMRYELPRLGICLDDKEGNKPRMSIGSLQYSEGDYNYEKSDFIYGTAVMRGYPYYYDTRTESRNIQIKANSKKNVRIFLRSNYYNYGNYTELLEKYDDYDALLIFETENENQYYPCEQLDQETLDKATAIPIATLINK